MDTLSHINIASFETQDEVKSNDFRMKGISEPLNGGGKVSRPCLILVCQCKPTFIVDRRLITSKLHTGIISVR